MIINLNTLNSELATLDDKIKKANCDAIMGGALNFTLSVAGKKDVVYHPKMKWAEKCEYVLRKFKKPLYSDEINEAILQLEYISGETPSEKAIRRRENQLSVSGILGADKKGKVKSGPRFARLSDNRTDGKRGKIRFWLANENEPEG